MKIPTFVSGSRGGDQARFLLQVIRGQGLVVYRLKDAGGEWVAVGGAGLEQRLSAEVLCSVRQLRHALLAELIQEEVDRGSWTVDREKEAYS